MALDDEGVETYEVLALVAETFLARGELKNLGDGSEVSALVVVM